MKKTKFVCKTPRFFYGADVLRFSAKNKQKHRLSLEEGQMRTREGEGPVPALNGKAGVKVLMDPITG